MQDDSEGEPAAARSRLRRPRLRAVRSLAARAGGAAVAAEHRASRRHRLRLDSAGRSGHRALGRRVVRAQPRVLRSREHRQAGDRGRLQRGGVDAGRARLGVAEVRAQDSVHREAQSQRVPLLPELVRSDPLRQREAGLRHGGDGRRRDDLLRVRGVEAADSGSHARCSSRRTSSGMFTVLWCYLRNPAFKTKEVGLSPRGRPDRAGQPPRRDDRGRHHQAEDAREQRRLQRGQLRQDAQGGLLAADRATTRST